MAAIVSNDGDLTDHKTGEAADLPPLGERIAVPAGEVFWQPKRDWVDELGLRHIHFQQRLGLSGPISTLLTDHYLAEGVPLAGGSLKMHYDAEGALYFVSGAYFDNPQPYGSLRVQTPLAAISRAWWLLENIAGFEMGDLRALAPEILEELLEFTELKLVSAGDGRTFSLVWEAPGLLANGGSMMVALNAGTEELIHFWDPNPHQSPGWGTGPCLPQSSIGTSATAEPQRYPTIPMRSGLAATPSTATPGYTHEAFWPETSGAQVQILGYRGTGSDACDFIGDQLYEIVPLPTDNQLPHYGPIPPDYDPQIVGDAVWKTQLTMEFFDSLGWDGWNDQGASAKIVVEGECMPGNAMFIHNNTENAPFGPNNSVLICSKDASEQ
ncbi:MAG: hypothetical protein DRJ61_13375, partial [Acidobacteria bacterium]